MAIINVNPKYTKSLIMIYKYPFILAKNTRSMFGKTQNFISEKFIRYIEYEVKLT